MVKRAFYVIGPESSGTRMMAKAFIRAGVFGDASHLQALDDMDFDRMPNDIMYRNSVPHGGWMLPIDEITDKMVSCGYKVIHIIIDREDRYLELSQVKRGHQIDIESAKENIAKAREHIAEQMVGVQPALVQYGNFVSSAEVRRKFFEAYSLPEPDMYFFNANDTYDV